MSYLSDSTSITDVRNIEVYGSNYFASDNTRGQIIEFDSNLLVKNVYGSMGSGPGKMRGVTRFDIHSDTIFAINSGKKTIECFALGNQESQLTIPIPEEMVGTRFDHRFVVSPNRIYLSTPYSGNIIASIDHKGTLKEKMLDINRFEADNFPDAFAVNIRNLKWLIMRDDNKLIMISDIKGEIQVVNLDGSIEETYQIESLPTVAERRTYIDKQQILPHTTYAFFQDVFYTDHRLYLLCISGTEKSNLSSNRILIFDVLEDNISFKEEIQLPGRWYSSVSIKNNEVFAFETTQNELQIIKL